MITGVTCPLLRAARSVVRRGSTSSNERNSNVFPYLDETGVDWVLLSDIFVRVSSFKKLRETINWLNWFSEFDNPSVLVFRIR
jgi:hypothetical protein